MGSPRSRSRSIPRYSRTDPNRSRPSFTQSAWAAWLTTFTKTTVGGIRSRLTSAVVSNLIGSVHLFDEATTTVHTMCQASTRLARAARRPTMVSSPEPCVSTGRRSPRRGALHRAPHSSSPPRRGDPPTSRIRAQGRGETRPSTGPVAKLGDRSFIDLVLCRTHTGIPWRDLRMRVRNLAERPRPRTMAQRPRPR